MILYGHPENYPPTLNAISCLSIDYSIIVFYRAHQKSEWLYPENVYLVPDGSVLSAHHQEQLPTWRKVLLFLRFSFKLWKNLINQKPDVVLLYDGLSVLSYWMVSKLINFSPVLWYHNHDVFEKDKIRKYSLSWWSLKAEHWIFPRLNLFSLPADERKIYFPMQKLKGTYVFLPNYPSISFYQQFYIPKTIGQEIKLLFQGQVGPGHGIEEVIDLMPLTVSGVAVKLVLKGIFRSGYDQWVRTKVAEKQITDCVEIHGFTPYAEVPRLGSQCHLGLAIFTKNDAMNRSLGTASNKIYEFAAMGLPILYYDNPHFKAHLGQFSWAIPTDLSPESIVLAIKKILQEYSQLSTNAHEDFLTKLNYEHFFENASKVLVSKISKVH